MLEALRLVEWGLFQSVSYSGPSLFSVENILGAGLLTDGIGGFLVACG